MSLLTISSPFGSGGKEIAQIVADGLNLEIYDDRKLLELAPEAGIRPEDLKDNLDDNLLTVDVSETGVIELGGLTHSQELLDRIIEVVHKVPGVSKVHSEIVIATSLYAGSLNRTRS